MTHNDTYAVRGKLAAYFLSPEGNVCFSSSSAVLDFVLLNAINNINELNNNFQSFSFL